MKPEARLWQAMKQKMWRPGDRLDRIENGISEGAPDVNGCLAGEDVWIELKAPTEPKRLLTSKLFKRAGNHALLQSQINWFARQKQAGGIAFILIRTDKRMMLMDGTQVGDFINEWTVPQMLMVAIHSCPVPTTIDDWRLLRNVIFTASRHRRLAGHAKAQQLLDVLEREAVAGDSVARGRGAKAR